MNSENYHYCINQGRNDDSSKLHSIFCNCMNCYWVHNNKPRVSALPEIISSSIFNKFIFLLNLRVHKNFPKVKVAIYLWSLFISNSQPVGISPSFPIFHAHYTLTPTHLLTLLYTPHDICECSYFPLHLSFFHFNNKFIHSSNMTFI